MKKFITLFTLLAVVSITSACGEKKKDSTGKLRAGRAGMTQNPAQYEDATFAIVESFSSAPIATLQTYNPNGVANYLMGQGNYSQIQGITFAIRVNRSNSNGSAMVLAFWDDYALQNNDPIYVTFGNGVPGFRVQQYVNQNSIRLIISDSIGALEANITTISSGQMQVELRYHQNPYQTTYGVQIGNVVLPIQGSVF